MVFQSVGPTILVIFGATGDLVSRKIAPALFHLFIKNQLPAKFLVLGAGRRSFSDADFQNHILEIVKQHLKICKDCVAKKSLPASFVKLFSYHRVNFNKLKDDYSLAANLESIEKNWGARASRIFYLAIPPVAYETILKNLATSGLTKSFASEDGGGTKIIVEKPFGRDLKSAQALETSLAKLFKENQIYRLDHYLAKEMVRNILTFRFSDGLLEQNWNKDFIEKIEIRLWEQLGVENRGTFYDSLGALRDVGQNHLLEILALVTMERPSEFTTDEIRKRRAEALEKLVVPSKTDVEKFSFHAQYKGYRKISEVASNSRTETYFKLRALLLSPRWQGVPIILESGKRLKETRKEIVLTLRNSQNRMVIPLEPKKKTGGQYTEEYEKLLLDSVRGDQTLFVSSREVKAMWRYVDPIIKAWNNKDVPLKTYLPDTDEPIIASEYINANNSGGTVLKSND